MMMVVMMAGLDTNRGPSAYQVVLPYSSFTSLKFLNSSLGPLCDKLFLPKTKRLVDIKANSER